VVGGAGVVGGGGMIPLPPLPIPCNENDSLELWVLFAFSRHGNITPFYMPPDMFTFDS